MLKIVIKVLEVFTLDYIPKFPISLRTRLFYIILPLRKYRDKIRMNKPVNQVTYQERVEFAKVSREGINYSGIKLNEFHPDVEITKLDNAKFNTHKLTPKNPKSDVYAIYFHGGGYYSGSVISHKNLLSQITASTNMVTYIFEYRLSPEAVFPSAHDDSKEVVSFLDDLEQGKDSIWIGESAGGGLAAGLCVDDSFTFRPKKLVLMSPWLDLSDKNKDRNFLKNKDILILLDGMHMMGEYYAGDHDPANPILSPVFADIQEFPDVLIQVCSNELLYNDAVEFSKKLKKINSKYELQVWDNLWHAWQFFPIKEAEDAREKIVKFINSESYSSSK